MGNTDKKDIIELGGRELKRVKKGLDEAQVASFIDELISERNRLRENQAHSTSLTRLAEKTIAEADTLAEQIKTEAAEQAEAESAAITEKAKEQAQEIKTEAEAESTTIIDKAKERAQQIETEAVEIANEKAKSAQAEAEKKAALLLENEREKIQNELSDFVNKQFGYLLEQLESLKQQATVAQENFSNNKLSQPGKEGIAVTMDAEEKNGAVTVKEGKESGESLDQIQETDQTNESPELLDLLQAGDQAEAGKPEWEVNILPPVNIEKIMKVMTYLDQLTEVKNTDIIPRTDMPSILVFLREPINCVDVLRAMPEVAYVEEITTDEDATNGEPRKVKIGLSSNVTSQEKK